MVGSCNIPVKTRNLHLTSSAVWKRTWFSDFFVISIVTVCLAGCSTLADVDMARTGRSALLLTRVTVRPLLCSDIITRGMAAGAAARARNPAPAETANRLAMGAVRCIVSSSNMQEVPR